VEKWKGMGYETEREYVADRFYDEVELEPDTGVCGDCDEWTRCSVKGHESVGWCSKWAYFYREDDERCE
jgi:hypothetical protein